MAHKNKTNISPYKTRRAAAGKSLGPSSGQRPTSGSNSSPTSGFAKKKGGHPAMAGKTYGKRPGISDRELAELDGKTFSGGKGRRGEHRQAAVIYDIEEASDRLYDLFRNHEFGDFPHAQRRQLAHYYKLLMEKQKEVNLTRLHTLREVGLKHFVDCLMVARLTKLQFPLMDLGTGPGLPGIPLKIAFPDETVVLAEGVQKRVEFLKEVREELGLQKLPILGRNINQWTFYPVNGVITRAVEDIGNTLGNVLQCLQTGGRVYFMKGPAVDPEIEPALAEWGEYYKLVENTPYQLPQSGLDRRLVVFEKIKAAPFPDLEDEPWPEGPDDFILPKKAPKKEEAR